MVIIIISISIYIFYEMYMYMCIELYLSPLTVDQGLETIKENEQKRQLSESEQLSFAVEAIGPLILPLKKKFEEYSGGANKSIESISSLIGNFLTYYSNYLN